MDYQYPVRSFIPFCAPIFVEPNAVSLQKLSATERPRRERAPFLQRRTGAPFRRAARRGSFALLHRIHPFRPSSGVV